MFWFRTPYLFACASLVSIQGLAIAASFAEKGGVLTSMGPISRREIDHRFGLQRRQEEDLSDLNLRSDTNLFYGHSEGRSFTLAMKA